MLIRLDPRSGEPIYLQIVAQVKHLVLFHHEPGVDDEGLETILRETIRFEALARRSSPLRVSAAYDGMVIDIQ